MGLGEHKATGGVAWMLIAALALVLGVAMASEMRAALEREREFRAAVECASVPVKASGCLWKQEFTVGKADTHRGERRAESVAGGGVAAALRQAVGSDVSAD